MGLFLFLIFIKDLPDNMCEMSCETADDVKNIELNQTPLNVSAKISQNGATIQLLWMSLFAQFSISEEL